jgi:hypothetical protein
MVIGTLFNQGRLYMSQQQKLERVLDLLLSEDSDQAAEILHQIIVEKARTIYESIVTEEDDVEEEAGSDDEVGGDPSKDFTKEISDDEAEIDADEENDGEAEGDDEEGGDAEDDFADDDAEDEFGGEEMGEGDVEDRVEDLESQLAELRAEFDALMGEEVQEPNHADLGGMEQGIEDEFGSDDEFGGDDEMGGAPGGMPGMGGDEQVVGEVVARIHEKKKAEKLEVAKQAKKGDLKKKGEKKVDEETQFLSKVADTGQRGTAKLVGTGKDTPLGAEQNKSPYTSIPARKDYGGKPTKIGGNGGSGGEYGKYNGDSAADKTITDNVKITPKNSGIKADTTAKYTGGKVAGDGFSKSPLTKKPA